MKRTRHNSGQMVVEAVLLIVVFLGITQMVSQYFKDNQLMRQFVEVPYTKVKHMAQNGNWFADRDESIRNHPMHLKRHVSYEGEPVQ
ncbi:MAG: hypothetical protein CL677_03920 [Bdellovibrionaceae bacterium]|nr:hypothetical protein [Pseudobdellovibrionaceae bacterium]|tara:strand:+ start:998 stop:1258 length:261 start_codon:yes stop_codon:yes gene_type:complete